ncbi:MAG: hypothetical protein C5B49_12885 [Bdellovibrio sp.]|nr:MAG: hypothetical protein C5B49_12885 [Bdellovibrio sp.]
MPKVNVDHNSLASADEAYVQIKTFFATDADIRKIDPNIKLVFEDTKKTGRAESNKFTALVHVRENGQGSVVSIVVDLPLIFTPLKGKVKETLEKKLKKYLA